MSQRILKLEPKDFLTGIAPNAHTLGAGLFYKADGITPLYDIGGTASAENGLLETGATPTDFSTGLADTIVSSCVTNYSGTPEMYMLGSSGHFYRKELGAGALTDLRDGTASGSAFVVSFVAATDILTVTSSSLPALGLQNAMAVKYTATTHGGLTQNTIYYVGTISGDTFKLYNDAGLSSLVDLTADTSGATFTVINSPLISPEGAPFVWGPANGTTLLYYFNQAHIGTWNLSGTFPTGWNDSVYTSSSITTLNVPVHKFVGNVYYGGLGSLGALIDNGDGTASHSSNVLDFNPRAICTGLTDDGRYLVAAISDNAAGGSYFSSSKVYFWDTFSDSWNVEWEIKDPYIWSLKSIGGVVYAFGKYGIYQVTFAGGVKKLLSRQIANYSTFLQSILTNDIAAVYNNSLLMWGNTLSSTIDTFGKSSPEVPSAYLKPFVVPSGSIRHINTDFDAGRVYVSTNTPKLYVFDFNNATHDTGRTAQTIYFDLDQPADIVAVRVVFATPLVSGDQLSVSVFSDEATSAKSYGSVAYTSLRKTRAKTLRKKLYAEDQFSLQLSFDAGAPKVKKIEVFAVFRKRID